MAHQQHHKKSTTPPSKTPSPPPTYSLTLVLFKQLDIYSKDTAHWGLLLVRDGHTDGTLYHASKESYRSGRTDYKTIHPFHASQSNNIIRAVGVASRSTTLSHHVIDTYAKAAADNRPFDLVVNNCQAFVTEVLLRLVSSGHITQAQYDALAAKGFQPLVSRR